MPGELTPPEFVEKWKRSELSERAASQEHFIDLCNLLGQPTPASHDATGSEYAFEKSVAVLGPASHGSQGTGGFADVWWRGKFAWEYKRKDKHKDLTAAYRQLCQYREALQNPPLLIVSDIARTEIHTNFTGTAKEVHTVLLEDMTEPWALGLMRRVFTDPHSFRPETTPESITAEVAKQFGELAQALRDRGHEPHDTAHFLMKCMFCLFAEDVDLLPNSLFERLLQSRLKKPETLKPALDELFAHMRNGGSFGVAEIAHFNGGLFDESPALELQREGIEILLAAAERDWGSVEPAIFGTLFERSLDPNTRAQIGAHYTSREDIMLVVEPVVMAPLRREWDEVRANVEKQLVRRSAAKTKATKAKADKKVEKLLHDFVGHLASIRILDPACGSGNFLYVAIQQLLDLEKQVITYAAQPEIAIGLFPQVRPTQLLGIEINPYAAELAQVVIWIGYLQWMRDHGFVAPADPILEPLQTIECRDAILDLSDPQNPQPATWPNADFIIGNPPFLGGGYIRRNMGDKYANALFDAYELPNFSDLCCYWFELGRVSIERQEHTRAGLLATQGIRGRTNRTVLERIQGIGDIFFAWSDRNWVLDGADVHVSIIGFDSGEESNKFLDGSPATSINTDLTADIDLTKACELEENQSVQFEGDKKGGSFDIDWATAHSMLVAPHISEENVCEVVRPWFNGKEVNGRPRGLWIVDFGTDRTLEEAVKFETPFSHIEQLVGQKYASKRKKWWLHERTRPHMRFALGPCDRFVVTVRHSPHRLFSWRSHPALPDSATVCFARSDHYFLGVIHSSVHVLWARRLGTQVREKESGDRYLAECFETFPLPWPPGQENTENEAHGRISEAAKELNEQRERWLNPPEWIEPLAAAVDAEDDFADVPEEARPLIRESAIMARAAKDPNLKKRTLTNLYNERPTWLRLAHEKLDRAVLAAYAAVDPDGVWSEDWAEVWTETGAGQSLPEDHELYDNRQEIDQKVLANLLRMNLERAGRQ